MINALILDFGGVLARAQSPAALTRLAALAGLPVEEFGRRYWQHREAYDAGLPATDYWRRVLDSGAPSHADLSAALIQADIDSWTSYREEVWEAAAAFRAAGGRTAMLSNGVPEIVGVIRQQRRLDELFDAVIISCEVGCAKPDPRIYGLCLERLGIEAAGALFVDDLPANLDAAARAGFQTLYFTGDRDVIELRRRLNL